MIIIIIIVIIIIIIIVIVIIIIIIIDVLIGRGRYLERGVHRMGCPEQEQRRLCCRL